MIEILLPVPDTMAYLVVMLMGMGAGNAFSKIDYIIQQTKTFTDQGSITQAVIKMFLDFFHHWWMGALVWLYPHMFAQWLHLWPSIVPEMMWFGAGIFLDDIRDFQHLLERYSKIVDPEPTDPPG